jgi:microsomal dipeptidase-like Zn-dependent dipeptidase
LIGVIAFGQATLGDTFVRLGTDAFGYEAPPSGFTGMHELPAVTAERMARGHSDETILKVLGGNYLRVFETVWGG